ncbi:MAG: hypothetical protein AB4426_07750 [Xenococcaceae cyanobacterium]
MSIEVILIPLALGAGSIALARRVAARGQVTANPENVLCFETQFKDLRLLQKSLQGLDHPCRLDGSQVQSSHGGDRLVFALNQQGTFDAYFVSTAVNEAKAFLSKLDNQYRRLVQQQSYETVVRRAEEQGMILEQEEVSEDGTVVLTFLER